ncbi:YbaK/EbsC family protein [Gluconobacter japonicus]|uniref:YbaK/EbsC family protein n=1 Tax=Gluconobacter japonicus TaxID=376620 RepID=UPI0024ACE7DD|nr:YbaK/EbsC family protein [Gluconobacter japonicus]MDI6652058.1 YbaK/EbsC family protein [Gluconobacter japonicus]
MSLESVKADLATRAPDLSVVVTSSSTATVEEAAATHGVEPDQIAKTLGVKVGSGPNARTVLVVMAGTNRLTKETLGGRPRFLNGEEVLALTSHPPGGVCPFGLPEPLPVYCDDSLRAFEEIIPAGGATNASVVLTPQGLAELTSATWVKVST